MDTVSVNIKKYIKVGDSWRFAAMAEKNGHPWWGRCMVGGQVEEHPEGKYYVEWYEGKKRVQKVAGATPSEAIEAQRIQQKILALRVEGVSVGSQFPGGPNPGPGTGQPQAPMVTLREAAEKFIRDKKISGKGSATIRKYTLNLKRFQESCPKAYASEVTRDDIMDFMERLQEGRVPGEKAVVKLESPTVIAHAMTAMICMNQFGARIDMGRQDWPRVQQKEKETYDSETMRQFFAACDFEERVLFETFLHTGFRDTEIGWLTWPDVDFKNCAIRVTAKESLGFTTKNYMIREVPAPEFLMDLLKEWKQRSVKRPNLYNLVFPTDAHWQPGREGGKRDYKMLNKCKEVAFRAGLNCGRCQTKSGHCSKGPYCSEFYLHRFRHTWGTYLLQSGWDICTVQRWMGHKDIKSTMVYLKPARGERVRKDINNGLLVTEFSSGNGSLKLVANS